MAYKSEEYKNCLNGVKMHILKSFYPILELTLEHFMLYMTTHLPSLTRTLLLWSKEPEFRNKGVPVFDLLINPGKLTQ